MMQRMGVSAVFLDRDGVINRDRADYVKSWEEFVFLPRSLEALALLAKTPNKIIIATNQSAVARGLVTEIGLREMHERMLEQICGHGGRIDAIYYCPHLPDTGCGCRKPAPGLFLKAAMETGVDLSSSWAIGDSHRDVEAAHRAGVKAFLLDRELPDPRAVPDVPFTRAANLLAAVRIITGAV